MRKRNIEKFINDFSKVDSFGFWERFKSKK